MTNAKVTNFNKTFLWVLPNEKEVIKAIKKRYPKRRYEIRNPSEEFVVLFYTHTGYDEIRVFDETIEVFEREAEKRSEYVEIAYDSKKDAFFYVNEDEINKNPRYQDRWELMEEAKNGSLRETSHLFRDFN